MFNDIKTNQAINYFTVGPRRETDMVKSAKITKENYTFDDLFSGIGSLKGTFSLQDE